MGDLLQAATPTRSLTPSLGPIPSRKPLAGRFQFHCLSYDLQIWSVRALGSRDLRTPRGWQRESGGGWRCSEADWQIVINPSDRVLAEDVEERVAALLPGIAYLTEL